MKRNKIITTAVLLLVAVIISTCGISGTFAKYTTSDNGNSAARVAKWGVQVSVDGGLFSDTYKNTAGTVVTVDSSSSGMNTVAPGTKNAGTGLKLKIEGTPEVAVRLTITVDATDVFVKYGGDEYHPVVFTLKNGTAAGADVLVSGTLAQIESYLEGLSGDYAPNTDLTNGLTDSADAAIDDTGTYVLSWEWAYNAGHDDEDTVLGNLMAGVTEVTDSYAAGDYSTAISFAMQIVVEQID